MGGKGKRRSSLSPAGGSSRSNKRQKVEFNKPFPLRPAATYVRVHLKGNPSLNTYASLAAELKVMGKQCQDHDSKCAIYKWEQEELRVREELESTPPSSSGDEEEEEMEEFQSLQRQIEKKIKNWFISIIEQIKKCIAEVEKMRARNPDAARDIINDFKDARSHFSVASKGDGIPFPLDPPTPSAFVKDWIATNGNNLDSYASLARMFNDFGEKDELATWRTEEIGFQRSKATITNIKKNVLKRIELQIRNKVSQCRKGIIREIGKCTKKVDEMCKDNQNKDRAREIKSVFEAAISHYSKEPEEFIIDFPFRFASIYMKEHFRDDHTLDAYASFAEKMYEELKDASFKLKKWKEVERKAQQKKQAIQTLPDDKKDGKDRKSVNRIGARVRNWRNRMVEDIGKCITDVSKMCNNDPEKAKETIRALERLLDHLEDSPFTNRFPLETPTAYVKQRLGDGRDLQKYITLADDLRKDLKRLKNKDSDIWQWRNAEVEEARRQKLTEKAFENMVERIGAKIRVWRRAIDIPLYQCEMKLTQWDAEDDSLASVLEEFKTLRKKFFELNNAQAKYIFRTLKLLIQGIEKAREYSGLGSHKYKSAVYRFVSEFRRCQRKLKDISKDDSTAHVEKEMIDTFETQYIMLVNEGEDSQEEEEYYLTWHWEFLEREDELLREGYFAMGANDDTPFFT